MYNSVLSFASGHLSHELWPPFIKGGCAVTWQKLAAACICLAQNSAHQATDIRKNKKMNILGNRVIDIEY